MLKKLIFFARVAEQAENFGDMVKWGTAIIEHKSKMQQDFTVEERNLISVGFKNHVGNLQTAIRVVTQIAKSAKYKKYGEKMPFFLLDLKKKLRDRCIDQALILKDRAYKVCSNHESMAFFQKLIGDYWRYAY